MMRMMSMGPGLLKKSTSSEIYIRLYDPVLTEGYLQQYDYPSSIEEYGRFLGMFEPVAHVGDITMKGVRTNLPIFIKDMFKYSLGLLYTYLILYTLSLKEQTKQDPDKEPFTLSCSHIFARGLGLSEGAYIDIRLLSNQEALALAHEKKYDAREQKASLEAVGIPFFTPFKYAKQCESCLKYLSDQDKAYCESCGMVVCHSCRPQYIDPKKKEAQDARREGIQNTSGDHLFDSTRGVIVIKPDASILYTLTGVEEPTSLVFEEENITAIEPQLKVKGDSEVPLIFIKYNGTDGVIEMKDIKDAKKFVEQYAIVKQRKRIGIQKCQRCVAAEGVLDPPYDPR